MHNFSFIPEEDEKEEIETAVSINYNILSSDKRLKIEQYQEYRERIKKWEEDGSEEDSFSCKEGYRR